MRIGIVTPAYDAAAWIADAIGSVRAQSHFDWRMVVVDDGSSDATVDVVQRFGDPRIRLVRQAHAGVSVARNRGIAELEADALLFLDADDWLAPFALDGLARVLAGSPTAVAAAGAYTFVGANAIHRPPSGDILERLLVRNCFANGGQLLLRRAVVRQAGGFLPSLVYGEDWEYWIRIAAQGGFAVARERVPMLFVRQLPGSAYNRMATDPAAFGPCMDAIYRNPVLLARFGAERLAAIRRRAEAENAWIVGRELIRHGEISNGRAWLRRSVLANPSARRAVLLAAAHALAVVPGVLQGPFRRYRVRARATRHAPHPATDW